MPTPYEGQLTYAPEPPRPAVSHGEVIKLFTDVLMALYNGLDTSEYISQERDSRQEFERAFGLEAQAEVCRKWIARLPKSKGW